MLSEVDKSKIKSIFSEYLDLLESRQTINEQVKDLVEEVSNISNIKKKTIRKAFTYLKKQYESGEDELDEISTLITEIK